MKSIGHINLMYLLINIFSVIVGLIGLVMYCILGYFGKGGSASWLGYNENDTGLGPISRKILTFSDNFSNIKNILLSLLILTITVFLLLSSINIIKDYESVSNKLYWMIGAFCLIAILSMFFLFFSKENRGLRIKKAFGSTYICLFFSSISFFIVYSIYINLKNLLNDKPEQIAILVLSLVSVCVSLIGLIIMLTKSNEGVKFRERKKSDGEMSNVIFRISESSNRSSGFLYQ
uniref:Uncharacterized protein n=1 Tax=viral metagenome TaxID=1070528 RepID=A0A6C0DHC4_9ZZZZ